MWYQLKQYLAFRKKSVNAHGLHSPFMYNLATKCFYDKTKYSDYKTLKHYHKQLLKNTEVILVKDFGAGSKKMHSPTRRLRDIALVAGSSYADMKRLYRLSKYFKPNSILELGTSLGKSAFAMALGNPNTYVITVEGDSKIADIAKKMWRKFKLENVEVYNQKFDDFIDDLNRSNQKFDMIFLDGHHQYEPTIRYFEKLQQHIHNDTVVMVDDIYWSDEMQQAWQDLKRHKNVKQSIDTYHFGILFFRKGQFKQNFTIRL